MLLGMLISSLPARTNNLKPEAEQADLEHNVCGLFLYMNITTIASEHSWMDEFILLPI